jgi:hypothetical protein
MAQDERSMVRNLFLPSSKDSKLSAEVDLMFLWSIE